MAQKGKGCLKVYFTNEEARSLRRSANLAGISVTQMVANLVLEVLPRLQFTERVRVELTPPAAITQSRRHPDLVTTHRGSFTALDAVEFATVEAGVKLDLLRHKRDRINAAKRVRESQAEAKRRVRRKAVPVVDDQGPPRGTEDRHTLQLWDEGQNRGASEAA